MEPLRALKWRPPRVDQVPEVADQGRSVDEADPEDDPDERRCDVAIWILIADESSENRDDEYAECGKPDQQSSSRNKTRLRDRPAGRGGEQVDMARAGGGRDMAGGTRPAGARQMRH